MWKLKIGKYLKSSGTGVCILVLMFAGSMFIIASGGGGDGGTSAPEESAVLTQGGSDVATSAAMQSFDMAGPSVAMGGSLPFGGTGAANEVHAPLRSIVQKAFNLTRSATARAKGLSAPLTTQGCTNGGTVTMPDPTPDELLAAMLSGSISLTATYNSCVEGPETMDGTMTIRLTGDFENDNFSSMTITTSLFHYENTGSSEDIIMTGYQMITDQMVFNASDELIEATITVTGDVIGTLDGQSCDAGFWKLALNFEEDPLGVYLTINGMLNNDCIGGWATISTAVPIFFPAADDSCPTEGDFSITSMGNTVRAVAGSSKSVTIYFNNAVVQTHTDCSTVENECSN